MAIFPRWERWGAVYQQTQRWLRASCFETMVHDLRLALCVLHERKPTPTAAIYDSRVLSSTPESGERAGYNGRRLQWSQEAPRLEGLYRSGYLRACYALSRMAFD
jgi:hypothetical protein